MSKGNRIRLLRESQGLSQVSMAEKIGVSKQTLYKYENDIITNIPSDKIEEIATSLGYANTTHFIRQFKDKVGVSPSNYRKKHNRTF